MTSSSLRYETGLNIWYITNALYLPYDDMLIWMLMIYMVPLYDIHGVDQKPRINIWFNNGNIPNSRMYKK